MSKVVRSSKFRHVFGTVAKKENCYDGVKPSRSAWDSNKVAASSKFVACIWDASGGGAFAVLDSSHTGKLGQFPLVTGHSGEVLDIDFSPFNPNVIVSVSDDCYGKIWSIPDGGLKENMNEPAQTLSGHKRKIGTCNFHPTANNIVATTSSDFSAKVWDVETGAVRNDVSGHTDIINSSCWDYVGNTYLTASKDKKIRIFDPRSGTIASEYEAHPGIKGMRVSYLGSREKIFTMGFSKMSERQYSIWDPKNLSAPLKSENIDTSAGLMMPFFDNDTSVLFLAGKGDGNIRYYEIVDEAPYIHYLSEYKSATPQRGMCLTPKLAMDLASCEIVRLVKVCATTLEPIHFNVPRKSDIFQDDLYPPTFSGEPSLTAAQWFDGATGEVKMCSLAPGFVAPTVSQTEFKAVSVEKKEQSVKELTDENEKQAKRIAYLEAELAKRDARIKDLENK